MANHTQYGHECDVCKPKRAANSILSGPTLGRRNFFKLAGAGVAGFALTAAHETEVLRGRRRISTRRRTTAFFFRRA
jgi:hypothetical protein